MSWSFAAEHSIPMHAKLSNWEIQSRNFHKYFSAVRGKFLILVNILSRIAAASIRNVRRPFTTMNVTGGKFLDDFEMLVSVL